MSQTLGLLIERIATPIGELLVVTDEAGALRGIEWADRPGRVDRLLRLAPGERDLAPGPTPGPAGYGTALRAYFAGVLTAIDKLPGANVGSAFQRVVWSEVRRVPAGATISYATLARRIGRPEAARAVGLANGANGVVIVVPCHRLVGSDGSLTGYGGGLERKQWLIEHERRACDPSL